MSHVSVISTLWKTVLTWGEAESEGFQTGEPDQETGRSNMTAAARALKTMYVLTDGFHVGFLDCDDWLF